MRSLQNDDMYILSEIIDKMGLELPKKPCVKNKNPEEIKEIQEAYGKEIITLVVKRIYKAKNEINTLLAAVSGKTVEEVTKMPVKETIEAIKELINQEGIMDFFKSAAS